MHQEVSRIKYNVVYIIEEEALQLTIRYDVIKKILPDY